MPKLVREKVFGPRNEEWWVSQFVLRYVDEHILFAFERITFFFFFPRVSDKYTVHVVSPVMSEGNYATGAGSASASCFELCSNKKMVDRKE